MDDVAEPSGVAADLRAVRSILAPDGVWMPHNYSRIDIEAYRNGRRTTLDAIRAAVSRGENQINGRDMDWFFLRQAEVMKAMIAAVPDDFRPDPNDLRHAYAQWESGRLAEDVLSVIDRAITILPHPPSPTSEE